MKPAVFEDPKAIVVTDGVIHWATWSLLEVAGERVVCPTPRPELSARGLRALEQAWMLADEGELGRAAYWVGELERLLWRGFDRPWLQPVAERPQAERAPAAAAPGVTMSVELAPGETLARHLLLSAHSIGLSAGQIARLRAARRLEMGTVDKPSRRKDLVRANEIAAQVRGELSEGLADTIAQELQRGGTVVRLSGGRIRMAARDGLSGMYDDGALLDPDYRPRAEDMPRSSDPWQMAAARLQAGLAYREMHEQLEAGLRSQLARSEGGRGLRFPAYSAWRKALRGVRRAELDRLVQQRAVSRRAFRALWWVAGEGRSVRSLSGGGKAVELDTAALIEALDILAIALKIPGFSLLTR